MPEGLGQLWYCGAFQTGLQAILVIGMYLPFNWTDEKKGKKKKSQKRLNFHFLSYEN